MSRIRYYSSNGAGRDFVVGDIHGHFTRLQESLTRLEFDESKDRLFSVGDLVDRGPECHAVLEWLAQPWFHAVQGNHEDMAIRFAKGNSLDLGNYRANGGAWMIGTDEPLRSTIGAALGSLPIAMQVETADGPVGIVHADCPFADWAQLVAAFEGEDLPRAYLNRVEDSCMWERKRVTNADTSGVEGLRALVVGHTPMRQPLVLGNVFHIDTAGWTPNGYFTFLELSSLTLRPTSKTVLDWGKP